MSPSHDMLAINTTCENDTHLLYMKSVNEIVNCIFISCCLPFILIGNLMVIVSVARFRQLQTSMNIFVTNLAVADLLVGFPTIPLYILFFVNKNVDSMKYLCLLKYTCVLISLPASALNLLLVTVDRFIAVVYPFHYPTMVTKTRVRIMITIVWVYSIGSATMPLYGVNTWQEGMHCEFWEVLPKPFTAITTPVMQSLSLGTTVLLYIKIFYEAKKNQDRIDSFRTQQDLNEIKLKRDTKIAKVMAMVFLMFLIFWIPFFATGVLKYTKLPHTIIEMVKQCTLSLAMSNSMINPIIYCWVRKEFRMAFRKLACLKIPTSALNALHGRQSRFSKQFRKWSSSVIIKMATGSDKS